MQEIAAPGAREEGEKMMDTSFLEGLLRHMVDHECSDLHLKVGSPPSVRVHGTLEKLDLPVVSVEDGARIADLLLDEDQADELKRTGEVDLAYSVSGVGRFRLNLHRQRGTLGLAARRVLPGVPSLESLGLPPAVETLAREHRGLLLVTGPTSSGKTTTCGAILGYINATRACHILTIEDPIEILHRDDRAVVTQREVGQDTEDFDRALRAAMRQDPDVIFVGEIRDAETVKSALQAAETGHLVIATLHTTNVAETVNRIVDFFPAHQQKQTRVALAGSLAGVMSQRLLPRVGGGRVAAIEVMIVNGRIRDAIVAPEKGLDIHDLVSHSNQYGMQTFDQAITALFSKGLVTLEDAKSGANSPHDLELELKKQGHLAI